MSALLREGSQAPEFTLKALDGAQHSLSALTASGPIALVFFKVSCPVCQFTLPFLDRIAGGLRIFAVSQDEPDTTRRFAEKYALGLPMLLDEASKGYPVSNAFGISMVPTLFLVEPGGAVSVVAEGFSKKHLEDLGRRAGAPPFRAGESVPAWKAG